MSSSISNATSQQQFFQQIQSQPKQDASAKANTANAAAPLNAQQALAPSTTSTPNESQTTKNSDGTYGPKHLRIPPNGVTTSSNAAQSSQEASEAGVDVKI